jgi:DNA-binding PadR family transcriptional regulator
MDRIGYNNLACQIALRSLLKHEYITTREAFDRDGDRYELYSMTSNGWNWVTENVEKLELNRQPIVDEIPF